MNKKILFALIPMIFLGLFGSSKICIARPDSGPAVVSLNPASNRVLVGNDVSVDVMISNVEDLGSWEFELFYETRSLKALTVIEGPFLKLFAGSSGTSFTILEMNDAYNSTNGLIWARCIMLGAPTEPATGDGVLATVKFRCSDTGASHVALDCLGYVYPVKLEDTNSIPISCTTTEGADIIVAELDTAPMDVIIDVGALYFAGEQVEFYVMTAHHGVCVAPTSINVRLYNPDGESVLLTPQAISTGFYKVTYTMPLDASSGTWAIVVTTTYFTDFIQSHGISFKTYLFSSTLDSLQASVISIQGSTATIQTSLGTIQGTITSINNNIATIQTNIGIIRTDISTIKANTTPTTDWTTIGLYISLALLASIAVVLVVLYLYLRARFPAETAPS